MVGQLKKMFGKPISNKEKTDLEDLVKIIKVEKPEFYRHLVALIRLCVTKK
jgi:hypothetical protein